MKINLHFLTSLKKRPITKAKMEKIKIMLAENLEKFLKKEFKSELKGIKVLEISVFLAGSKRVKTLNHLYRQKNKTTDVLSFPVVDHFLQEIKFETYPSEFALGDIVIDWSVCQKQSKAHQLEPWLELIYLIHHGFLHLLGFDHERSTKEAAEMQKMEDQLFAAIRKIILSKSK